MASSAASRSDGVDPRFDVIVVGSGAGALTAAISARASGLRPLVLEKTQKIGGTSSLSGGLFWVPDNPLMREAGIEDSPEAALAYLDALVGDRDPAAMRARREAFVRAGAPMVAMLRSLGMQVDRCDGYPDYYPDLPGASLDGRPLEPRPFDTRELGQWRERLRPQSLLPRRIKIRSSEFAKVSVARHDVRGAYTLARVALRSGLATARGVPLAVGGEALVGRLLLIALGLGVTIWPESGVTDLWVEDGSVVGVAIERDGEPVRLRGPRGVILAAGGYARNAQMREEFARQPSDIAWTNANEGETGDLLQAAMRLGAAVARMEEAWYSPMSRLPSGAMIPHNGDRTKPHSIIVDGAGNRFVSEAANYNRIGQTIYEHNRTAPAIPAWLVMDSNHRRRYPFFTARPGQTPKAWLDSGYMRTGGTLRELADRCGIDAGGLERTVARFNAFARNGRDEDFQRGDSAYERYMADPSVKPNPSLGPLERPPFFAVAIYPGDLGTCGGLLTTESAQVVASNGSPIPGLYAAGNISAPLAAGDYWGAGASIGASMVLGYIAARSCAGGDPLVGPLTGQSATTRA